MKQHRTQRVAALGLLALLGLCGGQVQADTQVRTSSFEYDASGLLVKEVIEPDRPNDCLQTSYSYDAYGNRTGVSTSPCAGAFGYAVANGIAPRTASSSYGSDGRFPLSTSNALGQSETRQYDARFGAMSSLTGPNGLTTRWEYDGFGRKVKEVRADGTYTTWAYKLCAEAGTNCPGSIRRNAVKWVTIEQSYATNAIVSAPEKRGYYDTLNRVVRRQTAGFDGVRAAPTLVQDTEYDEFGRVVRQSNVYNLAGGTPCWSWFYYDVLGRVLIEQSPDPGGLGGIAVTTQSYSGLTTVVTNSKKQTKTITRNAQGQVAQVTDAQGNTITYRYDAFGQLVQTNAAGSITTMAYNQRGQKTYMSDPAMGAWEYGYNAFGELAWQRDSLGQVVVMGYDRLGRVIQRTEADLVSQWSYDTKFDGYPCGKSVGKLCEARADNGYKRVHSYDSLGRPSSTATVLDNPATPAVVSVSYDAVTGRLAGKTWPTGYQARYVYSAGGYLKQVIGGGSAGFTQTVSYEVLAMDAQGHITQYKQGNQVTTVKAYDEATGRLGGQTVTRDGQAGGNVLSQTYTYDLLGSLVTRADNSPGVGTQESFSYDSLNRLTLATLLGGAVSPPSTTEVKYDARGNITYKSDVGRYWYDAARPNRMTNITLETAPGAVVPLTGTRALAYAFDDYKPGAQTVNGTALGNGNLEYTVSLDAANVRHTYRGESYTSFNMPATVTFGSLLGTTAGSAAGPVNRKLAFVYGPEHQRIKQTVTGGPSPGTTWYLNGEDSLGLSYEKEQLASGITENKHYLSAGGVVFALFVQRTGTLGATPTTATRYFHHDHLGSIAAVSDESGTVIERMAFDPWGKRRFVNGRPDTLDAIVGVSTHRGYTMHEHLDEMGVTHMNGRVYDPLVGRFMSADPTVPNPFSLKSFNRYSYVLNNPLKMVDPTGFSEDGPDTGAESSANGWDGGFNGGPAGSSAPSANNGSITNASIKPESLLNELEGWVVQSPVTGQVVIGGYKSMGYSVTVGPLTYVGDESPAPTAPATSSFSGFLGGGFNATSDFLTLGYSTRATQAFNRQDYVGYGLASLAGGIAGAVNIATLGEAGVISNALSRGVATAAREGAANIALHEAYKDGLRAAMGKPAVSDPVLSKLVDQLYRPNATVGSGSTAAAVRQELTTNQAVGEAFHSQKAADSIRALEKWLSNNPAARPADRAAAENIIRDMSNALRGQ